MKKFVLGTVLTIKGAIALASIYHCNNYDLYTQNPLERPEQFNIQINEDSTKLTTKLDQSTLNLDENPKFYMPYFFDNNNNKVEFHIPKNLGETVIPIYVKELIRKNNLPKNDSAILSKELEYTFSGIKLNGLYKSKLNTLGLLSCNLI